MALTVLEGSIDGLRHQGRPKRQWMDDMEEWSGCSYIQLKEMSQDRDQWRRKTIEWSSADANRHWRWSTSEWVRVNVKYCMLDLVCIWMGDRLWEGKPVSVNHLNSAFYPLWDDKMSISFWAE